MLRLLSKNGLVSRAIRLTPQADKRIQFFLSDIGEGTKEVVIKGKLFLLWFMTLQNVNRMVRYRGPRD